MSNGIDLLRLWGDDGKYFFKLEEVMVHHNLKTKQAVSASRRAKRSRLDMLMVFDLIAEENGIALKNGDMWTLQALHVAKHNNVHPAAVYQSRSRGSGDLDKLLFFDLMVGHFLDNKICGDEWFIKAYMNSGMTGANFCIQQKKDGE